MSRLTERAPRGAIPRAAGWGLTLAAALVAGCGPGETATGADGAGTDAGDAAPRAAGAGVVRGDDAAPAVLLVTLDTTRADHVGAYGSALGATPRLDALAAEGLLAERAWATTPITLPSHASILSGAWPAVHGVRDNGLFAAPDSLVLLPEVLAEEGWRTAAFVAAFVLDERFGLDQGFEVYDGPAVPLRDVGPDDAQRRAGEVVDAALAWLHAPEAGPGPAPLLLWCHFFDAHLTYDPPAPFAGRFERAYDGEIAYADAQLGRLVDAFVAATDGRPVLVVVVGDHGESLGEHGEATHGVFIHDATLRVPLVVWGRGVAPGRTAAPASIVDVAPTVLDWAGIDPGRLPDAAGVSLLRAAPARPRDGGRPLLIESELPFHGHGWSPMTGLVAWPLKLVRGTRSELYDLAADPSESDDLSAARPDDLARLLARHDELLERLPTADSRRDGLTAVDAAMLRALGYVGHAEGGARPAAPAAMDPRAGIALLAERELARFDLWRGRRMLGRPAMLVGDMPPPALSAEQAVRRQAGLGLIADARVRLAELQARQPDDPELASLAGLAAAAVGDPEEAARQFERQARLTPRSFPAHYNLGASLARLGRDAEAEAAMTAAFRCDRRRIEVVEWFEQRLVARDETGAAAWLLRDFAGWARRRRLGEQDRALVERLDARAERYARAAGTRGQAVAPPPSLASDD